MKNNDEKSNKEIIREYIEVVLNEGKSDKIADYISKDYAEVYDGKRFELGINGAYDHIAGVRKTHPDIQMAVDRQISEGEWVATSYTMSGTEWLGIKPTGNKITVTGVNIDRVVNGKIIEHGGAANLLEPMLRIGAIKIIGLGENEFRAG